MFWDTRRIIYDQNLHSVDTEDYVRTTSTSKWQRLRVKLVYRAVLTNFVSSLCHHVYIQRIQRFTMLWISLQGTTTRRSSKFSAYLQRVPPLVTKTKLRTLLPSWTNHIRYSVMFTFRYFEAQINIDCRLYALAFPRLNNTCFSPLTTKCICQSVRENVIFLCQMLINKRPQYTPNPIHEKFFV